ncbi:MAG: hypothetical protein LIO97_12300 [Tannerellaceae bacterium]|nr:hypothetical protein [Tannerellaceae bacterium]
MASIYPDHGWGGKNGDITDRIFRDTLEFARDKGKELLGNALHALAGKIETRKNAVVVFNDLNWQRTNPVTIQLDEKTARNTLVKDPTGKPIASQLVKGENGYELQFIANEVPSLGYKTFYLSNGKSPQAAPASVKQHTNYYENEFYRITLSDGGIKNLFDKTLNREILNTTKFKGGDIINGGYQGNGAGEFTQVTPPTPGDLLAISSQVAHWQIVESGALFTTFENRQHMQHTEVIQQIRIYHTIKKIDMDITLTNFDGIHNRQFRMALPLEMDRFTINYEVPMGMVEVGKDEMKTVPGGWAWGGTYRQQPAEINPREIQNLISANGEGFGLTLSSCVAVADWVDPSREAVAYPVLQAILLSSHKSCHGLGNWYEQKGRHHYSFSLLAHEAGW